jgi:hypothetical protein
MCGDMTFISTLLASEKLLPGIQEEAAQKLASSLEELEARLEKKDVEIESLQAELAQSREDALGSADTLKALGTPHTTEHS